MLTFVIFGNYAIHLFFKKRKQKLILDLNGIEYDLIEKVKTDVTGKSRISYSWRLMRSDIIMYNKNIVVLPYNYHLKGLIKQYQPILQYTFDKENEKLNGVSSIIRIDNFEREGKKIILNYSMTDNLLKGRMKTELDLSEKDIDLDKIIETKKYVAQQRI